jgi:NAD(P)-dependent dehydrogenase (short-subunit alcohol dehydrogenase family)
VLVVGHELSIVPVESDPYADLRKDLHRHCGASGLGRASAETILAAGGNVVIVDVNAETGKAAEQALGPKAKFSQTDVTSEEQVKAAVDLAVSSFGGLHGVLNAAGIGPAAKVLGRNGPHPLGSVREDHQGEPGRHVQCDSTGRRGDLTESAAEFR